MEFEKNHFRICFHQLICSSIHIVLKIVPPSREFSSLKDCFLGKSVLQILVIVSIPVSRCVNVCVWYVLCKCMLLCRYNSEKNHQYIIKHFQSNRASLAFLLLDLLFKGQSFDILSNLRISCKWWEVEQTLLLSSNRKSSFRLTYVHLTLTYCKGQVKVMHILIANML